MIDVSEWITDNAQLVIAVMVVASAVVAVGVPMVDRSTSLDQFQTDADEADALDYVDANFSRGTTNTTSAQVIVRDQNVLEKETLVSILEYERALQTNETVNETLVENDSTRSVPNLIATAAIREDQAAGFQTRERELARTEASLAEALDSLKSNPNASVRPAFDAVDANTSVSLTEADYALFEAAVEERRESTDGNEPSNGTPTASAQNGSGDTGNVTEQILADEYAALAEDRRELANLDPTLEE